METTSTTLYLYDDVRRLLMKSEPFTYDHTMDNAPMLTRPLKAHKGLDNKLVFRVFSPDRKPANICNKTLYARIINPVTHEVLIEKKMLEGAMSGFTTLELNEADISDIDIGLYRLVVISTDTFVGSQTISSPIFTDFDSNIHIDIEITDQAERSPYPSTIIETSDWTESRSYDVQESRYIERFLSESIPGNKVRNRSGTLHSFSTYTDGYSGKLRIFGSLDHNPSVEIDSSWFQISFDDGADFIEYQEFTGTRFFKFNGNYMWIRFVHYPGNEESKEKFNKIIARF